MDKAKQALESEYNELQIELKTLTQGKGDSEKRRKSAESLAQEVQAKLGESERQRQELADKMSKMQVRRLFCREDEPSFCLLLLLLFLLINVFAFSPSWKM